MSLLPIIELTMKKKIIFTPIAAAVIGHFVLSYLGSDRVAPVYTIESIAVLPASIERSWAVLTDFEQYPEWNPYAPRVEAEFVSGATVSFRVIDDNFADPLDIFAVLGVIDPPNHFFWRGTLGIQGLHDTKHGFALTPYNHDASETGSQTQLRHYEEFRGVLPWLLPDRAERIAKTQASFSRMNEALKQRLEEGI